MQGKPPHFDYEGVQKVLAICIMEPQYKHYFHTNLETYEKLFSMFSSYINSDFKGWGITHFQSSCISFNNGSYIKFFCGDDPHGYPPGSYDI